jgi:hypothetical protein
MPTSGTLESRVLDYIYMRVRVFFRRLPEYRDAPRTVEVNTPEQKQYRKKRPNFSLNTG